MTNIDRLDDLLFKIGTGTGGGYAELIDVATDVVSEVRRETAPQIIRTVEELEALDPYALLVARQDGWEVGIPMTATEWLDDWQIDPDVIFPIAVITPAEQVRAARKAMEEA